MKAWEMEEGKVYRAMGTGLKYKSINSRLWNLEQGDWSCTIYNNIATTDFEELKELVSWEKAREHMENGKLARFNGKSYKIIKKELSTYDFILNYRAVLFITDYLDGKWELL